MKILLRSLFAAVAFLHISTIIAPAKAQLPSRPDPAHSSAGVLPSPLVEYAGESTPVPAVVTPESTPNTMSPPSSIPAAPKKHSYNNVNAEGPYLAITFDDGPHPVHTPRLLDILKERGIKATFYVIGKCVAEYPEIVRRMVAEGHEVGNHTWTHPQLTKLGAAALASEINQTNDAIFQAAGVRPATMRPPYGATNSSINKRLNDEFGLTVIMWSVDPLDWKIRKASHVSNHIIQNAGSGSIVLAHDIHPSTIDAMPPALDALLAKGQKFVTVSELIAMDRPKVARTENSPPAPVAR